MLGTPKNFLFLFLFVFNYLTANELSDDQDLRDAPNKSFKALKEFDQIIENNPYNFIDSNAQQMVLVLTKDAELFESDREAYEKKIKDMNLGNFNFLGKKYDINSALMDYDIYICSSYFESSPISVREAMAMGLPILSTDVGDVKELLSEGGGLICNNLEEFVFILGKFLNGQLDLNSMSYKSSNFAKNNFSGTKCAEKHIELFNTISL